jgi:hypothetical protein
MACMTLTVDLAVLKGVFSSARTINACSLVGVPPNRGKDNELALLLVIRGFK